jgi:hypothetical protein
VGHVFSCPAFVTFTRPRATTGSSFEASNGLPGTMPIFAIRSTIGASAFAGGLSAISFASRAK